MTFFQNTNCSVQFGEDGVLFVNRCDGRATGDAFVIFETQEIAQKALENNRKHIGDRYIELFRATPAEVNQVMNSVMNPLNNLTNIYTNVSDDLMSIQAAAGAVNALLQGGVDCGLRTLPQSAPTPSLISNSAGFPGQPYANQAPGLPLLNIPNFSSTLPVIPSPNNFYMQPVLPGFHQVPLPTIDPFLCNTDLLTLYMGLSSTLPVLPENQVMPEVKQLTNNPILPRVVPRLPSLTNAQESALFPDLASPGSLFRSQQQQQLNYTAVSTDNLGIAQPIDQLARCFIRIRGMPLNTDITDILRFLQDHWRSVTLHGIHQVYDIMGQSTGEAIIQFVTETAAKLVCEQKNQNMFNTQIGGVLITVPVEVMQCTAEDLRQIIASNTNMNCRIDPNLLRNLANLLNVPNHQLQSLVPNQNIGNAPNHTVSPMANFQEYGALESNETTGPIICAQQLGFFNVPPPALPNSSYYANANTPQSLLPNNMNKPILQYSPHGISNLICIPPNSMGTLSQLLPKSTVGVEQLYNSTNIICPPLTTIMSRDGSMLSLASASPTLYVPTNDKLIMNDWTQSTWTDAVTDPNHMQAYLVPKVEIGPDNSNTETGISNSIIDHKIQTETSVGELRNTSEKAAIVRIQGLPKDVSFNEIANFLGEVKTNLKLFTIQLEYTTDGKPNGNASLLFKNLEEAKQMISQHVDKKLRGHRIHMFLDPINSV